MGAQKDRSFKMAQVLRNSFTCEALPNLIQALQICSSWMLAFAGIDLPFLFSLIQI